MGVPTRAMLPDLGIKSCTTTLRVAILWRMAIKISTLEVRERLGEYLNRVALRHDHFVIERKGKALAAMVPVEKLVELERAAREHALERLRSRRGSVSQREADRLADEAKHKTRKQKRA